MIEERHFSGNLPTTTAREQMQKPAMLVSLGTLKHALSRMEGVSDDTLVLIEVLPDELFTDGKNGWKVIHYHWDTYKKNGVLHKSYCPAIPICNFFVTEDTEGEKVIVATPHY